MLMFAMIFSREMIESCSRFGGFSDFDQHTIDPVPDAKAFFERLDDGCPTRGAESLRG